MAAVQPITFLVPASAAEPMEVRVEHTGLRMVLVNRDAVGLLDVRWRVLGVYFLLGPASDDPDRFRAYVGEVGRRNLQTRVKEHAAEKPWWSRALLITSASDDFNSAEIGWLEGRLWDVLTNAVAAQVENKGRPGDDSLPAHDRVVLERYVEPIMSALRACGFPPDTADQKPVPKGRKRTVYTESVKDLITAGLLKEGTQLVPQRRNLTEAATVLSDGRLRVAGRTYTSVSGAAQAVSRNQTEPGWDFWGAPSGDGRYVPLFELRARLRDTKETPEEVHSTVASKANAAPSPPAATPSLEERKRTMRRYDVTVVDLIRSGLLHAGEMLTSVRRNVLPTGRLRADGSIEVAGTQQPSLSAAARVSSGNQAEPGWEFWTVEREGSQVSLFDLRRRFLESRDRFGE